MHFSEILIDNRISCSFVDTEEAENIIFCRPIEESLDNVATIVTRDNEFIHNYITETSGDKFLITSVKLSDGEVFDNVKFKLIVCEEDELPASTINTAAFDLPSDFEVISSTSKLLHEEVQKPVLQIHESESVLYPEYIRGSFDPIIIEQTKNLQEQLNKQQKVLKQKEFDLQRRQSVVELNERIQKTLENYKSELLSEYYNTHEKQKDILSSQLNDVSTSLFKYIGEKLKDQKNSSTELLTELSEAKFKQLQLEHDQSIIRIKSEIDNLLVERIKDNSESIDQLLVERSGELQQLFSEKIVLELEEYKHQIEEEIESINFTIDGLVEEKLQSITDETDKRLIARTDELKIIFGEQLDNHKSELFEEFKYTSNETASKIFTEKSDELNKALTTLLNEQKIGLDNTVTNKITEISNAINTFKTDVEGRVPKLDKTIAEINTKINQLVNEKRNVQLTVDSAKQYTDTKVAQASEEMMNYARRILDLGGGGGSVAVQYANGGTMHGSLNITGQYLSGGIDISTLFGTGGGGTTVTTLSPYVTGSGVGAIQPLSGTNSASGYFANVGGGQFNAATSCRASVLGGGSNNASAPYATVAGGANNTASGYTSNVGGGNGNVASGYTTSVGGGIANTASNNYGAITGGRSNIASGYASFVGGGYSNCSQAAGAAVGGGYINTASGVYSNIGGGKNNIASGCYSAILGGNNNNTNGLSATFILGTNITAISADTTYVNNLSTINSVYTTSLIGSGTSEIIIGDGTSECSMGNNTLNLNFSCGVFINGRSISTITGTTSPYVTGSNTGSIKPLSGGNTASGIYSNIAGGSGNIASNTRASVGGGCGNTASNQYSVVAGGNGNVASGYTSSVGGGFGNTASNQYSNVGGGNFNTASGSYSSIAGGRNNVASGSFTNITGGYNNTACGSYSAILGGCGNNDNGCSSAFILGCGITATRSNTTYVNNLSTGGVVSAGTMSSSYLLGGGSQVVISDGSSETGNGNSTLSLNFLSGVYVSSSLTIGTSGSASVRINQTPTTFTNPVTASGQFLVININGTNQAIQLWNYSS